jgi:hypothetical protein
MTSSWLRAGAAVSVLVLAAGCGGKDDGGDSDFAKQSGNKIADTARADMRDLEQVKYSGDIDNDGASFQLDVQASATGDCTGTIGIGEGTTEVLATDGTTWYRPDEAFWRANGGDQAEAVIAAVGDKWVLDTDGTFDQFCDLDAFLDNIFSDDGDAGAKPDYKVKGTEEIDGEKVVEVERTGENGPASGYVLVDGKHYLVKLERAGDDSGAIEFSEFDKKFEVEAPAEDQVVDLNQL